MSRPMTHGVKPFARRWHETVGTYVVSYSPALKRIRHGWLTFELTELEVLDLGLAYDAQSLLKALAIYHAAAQRYSRSRACPARYYQASGAAS